MKPSNRSIVILACLLPFVATAVVGCSTTQAMKVDFTARPIRFVVDHAGWPRPFWWPRVTEFAIAGDDGETVWELRSKSQRGVLANELAVVFGEVPPDFFQVFPENTDPPTPLTPGRSYYAAAGGRNAVYRIIFALPVAATQPGPVEPSKYRR